MSRLAAAVLLIQVSVGAVMVAFGLHQMVHPIAWRHYVPRWLANLMPMPVTTFMRLHGFGNIVLGLLLVIGQWRPIIAWIVVAWWLSILPFAFYVDWRTGLRDLAIIAALCSLGLLVWGEL